MSNQVAQQSALFDRYLRLITEWNKRFNLTRITSPDEIRIKHFNDSLTYAEAIKFAGFDLNQPLKVADVGSGAGFPGIPLKIIYPHWNMTLIEATSKKCDFLNEVIKQLALTGITVLNSRAENLYSKPSVALAKEGRAVQFDVVVARAVAPLEKLTTWCLPLCEVLITQKGQKELATPRCHPGRRRGDPGSSISVKEFIRENKNLRVKLLSLEKKVFVCISR
jgi:16S rRNA (guanine527-N7)-methyltransferase